MSDDTCSQAEPQDPARWSIRTEDTAMKVSGNSRLLMTIKGSGEIILHVPFDESSTAIAKALSDVLKQSVATEIGQLTADLNMARAERDEARALAKVSDDGEAISHERAEKAEQDLNALREMIEHHRGELNSALTPIGDMKPALCDLVAFVRSDLAKLRKERDALRATLKEISYNDGIPDGYLGEPGCGHPGIASAALKEKA